ncbi:MAG: hypothetical protein IKF22_05040 [Lachnospiraceae bacterium]|nr:hypothetical protein [Lachnospiraceae bacterium]
MTEAELKEAARKEKNKLKRELKKAKTPAHIMKILDATIDNVALMKAKLDELREQIMTEKAMVEYDNGGGQRGVRENPIFKRYEAFFKTYLNGMEKIFSALPSGQEPAQLPVEEQIKPQTVLDQIRDKHREGL